MEVRPHLKVELTIPDKILEIAGLLLFILLWVFVLVTYNSLPENIPVHFNASGKADNYGSRITYFIIPVIGSVIFGGLTILNKFPWIYNYPNYTREFALQQYTYATKMIRSLKTSVIFIFLLINLFTWLTAKGKVSGLGGYFLPFIVALFIFPTAYYVIKSFKRTQSA